MENTGWIKLWRKIRESSINSDSRLFHLAVNLLLDANHRDKKTLFNRQEITIKRGQLIVGLNKLSLELNMKRSKVHRSLIDLENLDFLERKVTNRFTIITICNYEQYQGSENGDGTLNGTPMELQWNSNGTPMETSKEVKELKNGKNGKKKMVAPTETWLDELQEKHAYKELDVSIEYDKCITFFEVKGVKVSKRRFLNWLNRADKPLKKIKARVTTSEQNKRAEEAQRNAERAFENHQRSLKRENGQKPTKKG